MGVRLDPSEAAESPVVSSFIVPPTTVVIPVLDEEQHIAALLRQILDNAPAEVIEIIVADGGSTDRTRAIVAEYASGDTRVRLVENPLRRQAAGINAAVRVASPQSEVILRIDAHAGYQPSFVCDVLNEMARRSVDSVVVRLRTVGHTCFQEAVASVSNKAIGTGGAAHRMGALSRFVDHGHHAAIRKDRFLALNGYDEDFQTNEDAEFDLRLRQHGGRIWFAADIVIDYFPRSTPASLGRQYFYYGRGRAKNFLKHKQGLLLRQCLPPALTIYLVLLLLIGTTLPWMGAPLLIYIAAVLVSTIQSFFGNWRPCVFGAVVALPIMHIAWGIGFISSFLFRSSENRSGVPSGSEGRR